MIVELNDIIDKHRKIIDEKYKEQNYFEYKIIYSLLNSENISINNLENIYRREFGNNFSHDEFYLRIKNMKLAHKDFRQDFVRHINKVVDNLLFFLESEIKEKKQYDKIYKDCSPRSFYKFVPTYSKTLLIKLFNSRTIKTVKYDQKIINELISIAGWNETRNFLKDILNRIGITYGLKKELTSYEQEIEDLRTALDISKQEIDSLKEEIDEVRVGKLTEAMISFFKELNSAQNNYLLDQFAISAKTIKKLKKEKYKFPEQLESIPVNIRMFMKFVDNIGVKPMVNIGDKLKIDLEKSENYEYIGTPFEDSNKKMVLITKPGWKYSDEIISKPEVKEIFETEQKEGE